MTRQIYVLNGSNLNLLGEREPELYGYTTLADIEKRCRAVAEQLGFEMFFGQSNYEGQLIDWIHEARLKKAAVVINPAGYSFFSVPLVDALKTLSEPVIEVHITNIHQRTKLYQHSIVSEHVSKGVICGLGPFGYEAGLLSLGDHYKTADAAAQGGAHAK